MNSKQTLATAQTTIEASIDKVWDALINPEKIKTYMLGTTVISDWKEGSQIVWKGEWKGQPYADKGEILQFQPQATIQPFQPPHRTDGYS
jgi:uncharacterized protein YndB with AHSA1/START domain